MGKGKIRSWFTIGMSSRSAWLRICSSDLCSAGSHSWSPIGLCPSGGRSQPAPHFQERLCFVPLLQGYMW